MSAAKAEKAEPYTVFNRKSISFSRGGKRIATQFITKKGGKRKKRGKKSCWQTREKKGGKKKEYFRIP